MAVAPFLTEYILMPCYLPLKECVWTRREWRDCNILQAKRMTNYSRYLVESKRDGLIIWFVSAWRGDYDLIARNPRFVGYEIFELNLDPPRYAIFIPRKDKYYKTAKKLLQRYILKNTRKEAEAALNRCGFSVIREEISKTE